MTDENSGDLSKLLSLYVFFLLGCRFGDIPLNWYDTIMGQTAQSYNVNYHLVDYSIGKTKCYVRFDYIRLQSIGQTQLQKRQLGLATHSMCPLSTSHNFFYIRFITNMSLFS